MKTPTFKCKHCDKTYKTEKWLKIHINKFHTDNIEPKKTPDKHIEELKEYFKGRVLHNISVNPTQKILFKYAMNKIFGTSINKECAIHIRQSYIRLFKHFNNLEPDKGL